MADGLAFKVRVTFSSTALRLLLELATLLLAVVVLSLHRLLLLVLLLLTLGFLLLGLIALDLLLPLPTREARSTLSALATYSYVWTMRLALSCGKRVHPLYDL